MWLSLQAAKPGDYVFASGQQRKVRTSLPSLFAPRTQLARFRQDHRRTNNHQQVRTAFAATAQSEAELS